MLAVLVTLTRSSRRRFADERGLGLVEVLVAVTLLVVVAGVVADGVITGFVSTRRGQDRVEALTDVQKVVERMSRELRSACPVRVAEPHRVVVDGYRQGQRLRFEYTLPAGSDVLNEKRQRFDPATGAWVTLSDKPFAPAITNRTATPTLATFSYYDETNAATTNPVEAVRLGIALRRQLPEQKPIRVETIVNARNARGEGFVECF
ncbi:MAG: hypothetical protein M3O86_06760 [Actinomycetota bacterium]|nr:hypothetical protein [Actinomycetota bacterium]